MQVSFQNKSFTLKLKGHLKVVVVLWKWITLSLPGYIHTLDRISVSPLPHALHNIGVNLELLHHI